MNLDPKSIPEPLKRFFDTGLLTEDHIRIYVEYNTVEPPRLFERKYMEYLKNASGSVITVTDKFRESVVAYESWAQVMPNYDTSGELVSLMIAGTVRAYLKSGVYLEIGEIAYRDREGYTYHEYDADMGRL